MGIQVVLQNDRRRRRIKLAAITWPAAPGLDQALCCLDGCAAFIPKLDWHRHGCRKRLDVSPDALGLRSFIAGKTARVPGDNTFHTVLGCQSRDTLEILTP